MKSLSLSPAQTAPEPRSTGRLLIVDDLADNREILLRRFVRRGFEVVEADGGEAALRLIAEQEFDVVLLDMMMPGMDGAETLHRIRERHGSAVLPVIMVTAKSQSEDIVDALQAGANDYVTKPVDFAVALARVNNQIAGRRAALDLQSRNEALKTELERDVSERQALLARAHTAIQEEVSKRHASEDRIVYLASHDTLTGLPNRFAFDARLRVSLRQAEQIGSQVALLFLDLDGFKNVNDTLGHGIGDALLKEVSARIADAVDPKDFVARLGGDEFAILHISDEAKTSGNVLAEKIIATVASGCEIGGVPIFVGASIGVAVAASKAVDAGDLLRQADMAMYRAKSDGRGVCRFYEEEMGRRLDLRRGLETDLRNAINQGELQLQYQPVVDLKARRVTGVEALMRWNHPTRGPVPPTEFIPVAEETGLIGQMGEWALRQACADAVSWANGIRVAINLSPIQFRNMNLVGVVMSALGASGLPAERLELEITESVLMATNSQTLRMLTQLREIGVRISLDDFGTGYSGLGYFRQFQFDRVKIDQSFIREMLGKPESRAIVRAAIGLGRNMGISTTAEGVETAEQLECLMEEGCSQIQGYLFSRPLPSVEIARMVEAIREDFVTSER